MLISQGIKKQVLFTLSIFQSNIQTSYYSTVVQLLSIVKEEGIVVFHEAIMLCGSGAIASLGKSKKLKGKAGASTEKIQLPVETDAKKLVKYLCGSNLLVEGGQDIELKPDNEYPEWLWKLYIGRSRPLSELDPETMDYWRKVRALAIRQNHRLKSLRKF